MSASYYEDELTLGTIYDGRILQRLGSYLVPYRWPVLVAVVMMIGVAALELIPVLILREVIDGQIAHPDGARTDRLGELAVAFVASLFGIFVLRYVQAYLMAWVGQRVMMDLRMDLFRHIQRMSVSFFDRNPVGRLVTRLNNDINQLEQMISQGVVQMLTNLLMVAGIIVVLFILNWQLALIMYVFLVPLVFLIRRFATKQRAAFRDERIWIARLNAYLNELITGVSVVQLFNRQDSEPRALRRAQPGRAGGEPAHHLLVRGLRADRDHLRRHHHGRDPLVRRSTGHRRGRDHWHADRVHQLHAALLLADP